MKPLSKYLEALGAIILAIIWVSPLIFAFWAAFHSTSDAVNFNISSPWTLANFQSAWEGAPWLKYFINTFLLVTVILLGQFFVTTLAGFAFAQIRFPGRDFVFILVLMQLFILPEVLIVENYAMVSRLGLFDTILGVGMPYMASAFGIFLMRQAFKGIPIELHEAARIEGCSWIGILWRVYVPLARPTYLAYALVSVSTHWNNFLWPLIVTNTPDTRPLTCLLYTSPSPRDRQKSRMPSSA